MPEFAQLLKGYSRFKQTAYPAQRDRYDKLVADGQHPKLMIIGCSDSRVDPAQIFDVDPGEIFVLRNVAALVPPYETTAGQHGVSAAIEYASETLEVKQIVVMGHGKCGGCRAALTGSLANKKPGEGGFIGQWVHLLDEDRPRIVSAHGTESRAAERAMEYAAVKRSLTNLRSFPFLKEREEAGAIVLRGAFFALTEGILYVLDEDTGEFLPVD